MGVLAQQFDKVLPIARIRPDVEFPRRSSNDYFAREPQDIEVCIIGIDECPIVQTVDIDEIGTRLEYGAVAFFAVAQPHLRPLALGDVLDEAFKISRVPIAPAHSPAVKRNPDGGAVLALEPALVAPDGPLLFELSRKPRALIRVHPHIVTRIFDGR